MKSKLWILGMLLASCSSATDDQPIGNGETVFSPSYIVAYNKGALTIKDRIDFWSIEGVQPVTSYCIWFLNRDEESCEEFIRLAKRNGDTGFNAELNFLDQLYNQCFADNFTSIRFRSDRDWDGAHPAGTPLDDLVTVMLSSYAPFVRSGYDRKAPGLSQWGPYAFYQLHADRLTADQMAMVAWEGIGFYFDTAPDDPSQEHTLTVTLETVDGEQITVTARGIPPWGAYEPIG